MPITRNQDTKYTAHGELKWRLELSFLILSWNFEFACMALNNKDTHMDRIGKRVYKQMEKHNGD